MRLSAHTAIVCLGIASSLYAGCAQERDPINRVQANAMAKSFFVGSQLRDPSDDPEFRMKAFNIGGTVGQSAYSVGEYSALDRVRWEIAENLLIARKAYEIAPGADNRGVPKDQWAGREGDKTLVKSPNGAIVAAYKILSHFDVKRAYNPATGEELNVIDENTSDRAWYDREFIRVDWSQNIVDGPNDPTRFFSEQFGTKATPVAYTPSEPNADDAPHVDAENGYFDVTNKFTLEPEQVQFWGTNVRQCQLVSIFTGSPSFDCNAQEAVVRLSFAKIAPDEDFESFEDTFAWRDVVGNMGGDGDAAQTSFGGAPRQGWDPQYGFTDKLTKRFKNIHNLFKASHQAAVCSSNDDADNNGTADECENAITGHAGHGGSRCDVQVGKCTIPVRDREVKTVGYWLNAEAPDALQDELDGAGKVAKRGTLEDLTHSWNQLLEVSLAYRREVECRQTGDGDRDACHAEFFEGTGPSSKVMVSFGGWLIDKVKPQAVDKGKVVLTICHNPVRSYDPEETCGKEGEKARLGDQRKNFLVYWPFASRAPYGGVAGVTPDPVTGEIRGASATIMGRSATNAAALQRDIIQLALGDLKMSDLVKGVPAERYASLVRSGALGAPNLTAGLPSEEIAHRSAALDMSHLRARANLQPVAGATAIDRGIEELRVATNTVVDLDARVRSVAELDAITAKLATVPDLEMGMISKAFARTSLAGVSGAQGSALLDLASPLRGLDPTRIDVMREVTMRKAAERGACFHDGMAAGPGSIYLASLAGHFKAKYGNLSAQERGERIFDDLWKEAVKGIGLHELGHSIGLRHNFASSWDAPNYNPQYWQLRTNEGTSTSQCGEARSGEKDSCMGPRYLDPMSADEQGLASESRPAIDYFANTSTMEYQLERFGETVGLGTYDLHAMKTLYGRVLETFDSRVMSANEQKSFAPKTTTQLSERDYVVQGARFGLHYTNTARAMKVFDKARDCRPATDEEKRTAEWRVVHGQVCAPPPKDHWSFDAFESGLLPGFPDDFRGVKWKARDRDGSERVRWVYRYGEEYGTGGHLHPQAGDAGADVYEQVQNLTRRFELTYPWTYFRRQNREYSMFDISQSVAKQYFAAARGIHWNVATSLARSTDLALQDDDAMRPYAMAQADLMTFLQKAILQPEPGAYVAAPERTTGKMQIFDVGDSSKGAFTIGIGEGRYIGEKFNDELGGSWEYSQYPDHAGFEVEKALAMMQLVDPRPTLNTIARENFLDSRNAYVSFRSDLPSATDELLGGILAEDWESIAPAVLEGQTGEAPVVSVDLTRSTLDRTPNARVVFPNIGYQQQLQMAIFGAVFSRLGSDMTLLEKMRLSVDGDRAPKPAAARLVQFVDPRTGYVYQASRFDETSSNGVRDRGIASRVVARANVLLASSFAVKRGPGGAPIVDATGRPQLELDGNGQPMVIDNAAEGALRRYIGLMDAMRQLGVVLGDGPLGGGGN